MPPTAAPGENPGFPLTAVAWCRMDPEPERETGTPLAAATVESFARDLLKLVHAVRLYPAGHPAVTFEADRLLSAIPAEMGRTLSIGVNNAQLELGGVWYGAPSTRTARLAALLYERKILRLHWNRDAETGHVLRFVRLLAAESAAGADIEAQLESAGIHSIEIEPLDLGRIHDGFRESRAAGPDRTPEERRREAWRWLQQPDVDLEALASALVSSQLWEDLAVAAAPGQEAHRLVSSLAGIVDRIESAVGLLPEEQREAVFERLAELGSHLTPADLASLVARVPDNQRRWGQGTVAILRDVTPDRFIELLAHLTSASGRATRRLADVFRRFVPAGGTAAALERVQAKLESADAAGFARNVWQTLEDLLLRLEEDPFMAPDYAKSLDMLAEAATDLPPELQVIDLTVSVEPHVDEMFLALAIDGGPDWTRRLVSHVADREGQSQIPYAQRIDAGFPQLLDGSPDVVQSIVREGFGQAQRESTADLEALSAFCRAHEDVALDTLVQLLSEEQRMWSRRVIVDVLSSFSQASTPALAARARTGPWFVARNLAMVLGRIGGPRSVTALRSLADHTHAKVRREALRALSEVGTPLAYEALRQCSLSTQRDHGERNLAARLFNLSVQRRGTW